MTYLLSIRRRKGESSFAEKGPKAEKRNVVPLKDIADGKSAGSCELTFSVFSGKIFLYTN